MSDSWKGARFDPIWAGRIDLMADTLSTEFPRGATSVIQRGVEKMWAEYGELATLTAETIANLRRQQALLKEAADV